MIKLTIIYPSDPLGAKVGGVERCVKDIIKFSPADFEIDFIGVTSNKEERPENKWVRLKIGQKEFNFYPICFEKDENKKTVIPLSLRFSLRLSLSHLEFQDRVLYFDRIEPALFLKNIKTPKIGVIHNDIRQQITGKGSEVLWGKFPWLYFRIEDMIFRSLDHVYSVNRNTLEFYRTRYPEKHEKFSFLPVWADADIFFPSLAPKETIRKASCFTEEFLPIHKKWILYVGRLQAQKAPLRLIDTFFMFHQKNPESCLIMIGDGNLRKDVEKHIQKLNLEKDVFLLSKSGKKYLADFYRASDILLLTSNFEGMPRCVLEALGCGVPVVSTDVGEVKMVIKNNFSGEVVNSFLPQELAKGLEKVMISPFTYTKGNCVSCILEYTPEVILKPVYELIRELYANK